MITRCAPDTMNAVMAASSVQSERVQKVLRASRNMPTARLPLARRACSADRSAATKNAGKYRHDLTRKRVIETCGMCLPRSASGPSPRHRHKTRPVGRPTGFPMLGSMPRLVIFANYLCGGFRRMGAQLLPASVAIAPSHSPPTAEFP
jgi:hypothetical protein